MAGLWPHKHLQVCRCTYIQKANTRPSPPQGFTAPSWPPQPSQPQAANDGEAALQVATAAALTGHRPEVSVPKAEEAAQKVQTELENVVGRPVEYNVTVSGGDLNYCVQASAGR